MDASALDIAISALEKEVSRLEVSINGLEEYLWISSAAVAIGVTLEVYFIIHTYLEDRDLWRRGIIAPPTRPNFRVLLFEIASALLVVAGIVGELWIGVMSADRNIELRGKNSRLVGFINQRSSEANERTASLEKEAVDLRLRLANASIPRSIDADAQVRIAAKLPPRANGGQVNVMYLPWTFDGLPLTRQILGALEKAGIRNGPQVDVTSLEEGIPGGFASRPSPVFSGIQVMHTPDPRSIFFAYALAKALSDEHIDDVRVLPGLTIFPGLPGDSPLRPKVTVRIGRKP